MSIDLNWDTLTSGPDGVALAERIRSFIHDKFQTVPLPRFIKSVTVHGFDFGRIPPRLDLKDITDPLPDFYDEDLYEDDDDEDWEEEDDDDEEEEEGEGDYVSNDRRRGRTRRNDTSPPAADFTSPRLGTSTPGILGGPGLNYFHGHLGTGTQTPLAAVAGAHLGSNWMSSQTRSRNPSQGSIDNYGGVSPVHGPLREKGSVSTLSALRSSGDDEMVHSDDDDDNKKDDDDDGEQITPEGVEEEENSGGGKRRQRRRGRGPKVEDVQAVFRIQYSGDVRLNLTAEILLDYPMPSFVGIPLKLNITGLSFDGVGVTAHIRKRVHFCFLSPEDALAAVGPDDEDSSGGGGGGGGGGGEKSSRSNDDGGGLGDSSNSGKGRLGGLLQEIKVESEIGQGGRQSLKNVGKVERFVLEQVRRIFEEEFVYPSFWTFLV